MSRPYSRASTLILPFPRRADPEPAGNRVLAVVGGALDAAVLDLALVLARETHRPLDLLNLMELPLAVPLIAYSRMMARDRDPALEAALERCGNDSGDAGILLCRSMGAALVAETQQRRSACLVLGMPSRGWLARWHGRRALAHIQAHAACRVYVVHTPPAPEQHVPQAAAQ